MFQHFSIHQRPDFAFALEVRGREEKIVSANLPALQVLVLY